MTDSTRSDDRGRGTDRTAVVGRSGGAGPTVDLGVHLAPDGSDAGPVRLDCAGPHAGLVVGKRGSGKSYTLGVLAEELARTEGIAPVLVDPMGAFGTLDAASAGAPVPASVVESPTASPGDVDPASWCELLELDPSGPVGSLVWQAAAAADTLAGMRRHVAAADAADPTRRAATNHLDLADAWGVFDAGGAAGEDGAPALDDGAVTVLDVSGMARQPVGALVRAVANRLYRGRVSGRFDRLPWLLVDEAHVLFDGAAGDALRTLLTRGRQPGVSLVCATQRPGALPEVVASQSDLVVAHRLTGRPDREALARARPTADRSLLENRRPVAPGEATLVDDATETVRAVRVRERDTPHGGDSPTVGAAR